MTIIRLNVGGTIFETTAETLQYSSYLHTIIIDIGVNHDDDDDEIIFIDRSPEVFVHILNFLRDDRYPYPIEYIYELDFYGIEYDLEYIYKLSTNENILHLLNEININMKNLLRQNWIECLYCYELVPKNKRICDKHEKMAHSDNFIDTSTTSIYCSDYKVENNYLDE